MTNQKRITIVPGEETALDRLIAELPEGGEIVFSPGDYYLSGGIKIRGLSKKLRLYGEGARLIGGRRLSGIAPCGGKVRERFNPAVRDRVFQVDLRANGVNDAGGFAPRGFGRPIAPSHAEVFADGRPLNLSKWPKGDGYECITGYGEERANEWSSPVGTLEGGFFYDSSRPDAWAESEDIVLHGYWAWDWAETYERVALFDKKRRLIKTKPPYGHSSFTTGQRFCFYNILEEVTEPGDYYIDRAAMTLYFIPWDEKTPEELIVSVLEEPLISLDRSGGITVEGFTLEAGRGSALFAENSAHVVISDCHIRNMGNYGIRVPHGSHITVSGCTIHDCGDGGVVVNGGDRLTLEDSGNLIENNHIYKIAKWCRCYYCAVNAGGVGFTIRNNLIHDCPHSAVLFWGNEFHILDNEIYSVLLETGDAGAVYTGRDYTFRGNVVSGNFIHHLGASVGMGTMGVYNDDCVSGTVMENNIFQETSRAAYLGGGRDFVVRGNLFVDCYPSVELNGRGASFHPMWRNMVDNLMRNRFYEIRHALDNAELKEGLSTSAVEPPYITRYPELTQIDRFYRQGAVAPIPASAVIEHNVYCSNRTLYVGPDGETGEYLIQDNRNVLPEDFEDYGIGLLNFKAGLTVPGFRQPDMFRPGPDPAVHKSIPPRVLTGLVLKDGRILFRYCNCSDTAVNAEVILYPEVGGKKLEPLSLSFSVEGRRQGSLETPLVPGEDLEVEARSPCPGVRPCRFHGKARKLIG
jgi:hypothetical protein